MAHGTSTAHIDNFTIKRHAVAVLRWSMGCTPGFGFEPPVWHKPNATKIFTVNNITFKIE